MTPSNTTYDLPPAAPSSVVREDGIESGFIWHTTGSGKTLTSFNASTLLKDKPDIVKCLPGQLFYSTLFGKN